MTKKWWWIVPGLTFAILFCLQDGFAEPHEELKLLRKEIENLREIQISIQKEVQEIKGIIRRRQDTLVTTQGIVLSIDGEPFKGDLNARLVLIEFSDYQCPFCARHFREILPQLERDYVDTGKLRYVFRNFPIESIHKEASKAAEAAYCAGEQGKYWEMHDRLFANQRALGSEDLSRYAQTLELDLPNFQQCLESSKHAAKIRQEISDGQKAGVKGTPTFFLGFTELNEQKLQALRIIRGAHPYTRFREAIDSLLASGD